MNNLALNRLHNEQDQGIKNAEWLEDNQDKVQECADAMTWESIEMQDEFFNDIIRGEDFRDGDSDEIYIGLANIDKARRAKDHVQIAKALIDFGLLMSEKYISQLNKKHWKAAETEALERNNHDPREA